MLDPITLAMSAADAAGPSEAEYQAEFERSVRESVIADFRTQSCTQLTNLWPEVKALHQKDAENGQMFIETREQVIAEKGCTVPAPLAESTAQTKPDAGKTAAAPAAVAAAPSTPVSPAPAPAVTPASSGALSTSIAEYIAMETPERYRNRSCDYLHARLIETSPGLASEDPEIKQWVQKAQTVVNQTLAEKRCAPASWVGGRIGARISTIDPVKAPRLKLPTAGVWVEGTLPGSPSAAAGLLRGDTLVAVNGTPIADASEFFVIVLKQPIGSTIQVKFWRVNAFLEVPVVIGAPQ
ncbi:S1C family serine protease [Pseudomonas solani]|uniref:S1C family serine protease n=1 Tax=Pseudomonas solani TaxID=2731552 RepID=UPI003F4AB235